MNTMDAILTRQSCHAYTDEQITEEQLNAILVAANAAPVGRGRFDDIAITVLQKKDLFLRIEKALKEANPQNPYEHPLYNAPTCVLVSILKSEEPRVDGMLRQSAACLIENMLIEAADLGLASTYLMGSVAIMAKNQEMCAEAKVPEGFTPVAMAAVGYSVEEQLKREPVINKFMLQRVEG